MGTYDVYECEDMGTRDRHVVGRRVGFVTQEPQMKRVPWNVDGW
jgi:hypothetical protein